MNRNVPGPDAWDTETQELAENEENLWAALADGHALGEHKRGECGWRKGMWEFSWDSGWRSGPSYCSQHGGAKEGSVEPSQKCIVTQLAWRHGGESGAVNSGLKFLSARLGGRCTKGQISPWWVGAPFPPENLSSKTQDRKYIRKFWLFMWWEVCPLLLPSFLMTT